MSMCVCECSQNFQSKNKNKQFIMDDNDGGGHSDYKIYLQLSSAYHVDDSFPS